MAVAATKGILEEREQTTGTGKSEGHGAELAKELVPFGHGDATAG